jgi:hypothetical protein
MMSACSPPVSAVDGFYIPLDRSRRRAMVMNQVHVFPGVYSSYWIELRCKVAKVSVQQRKMESQRVPENVWRCKVHGRA